MYYVTGKDSDGEQLWLNHQEQWTHRYDRAKVFRLKEAEAAVTTVLMRNRNLDRADQIEPSIQRELFS